MKTRNLGLTIICIAVLLGAGLMGISNPAYAQSPPMDQWVDPLPVPPVATKTFKPLISRWADYYEINMTASQHKFHRDLARLPSGHTGSPGRRPSCLARRSWRKQAGPW